MSHLRTIPLPGVKLGDVVRTGERAVLAAEALVVEMLDDPGDRVFLVGVDRAGVQAGRVEAVVARRRHVLEHRQRWPSRRRAGRPRARTRRRRARSSEWQAATHALQPEQRSRSTSKASCWPGPGGLAGSKCRVVPALKRLDRVLVKLRESLDGAQVALLGQERVDRAGRARPVSHDIDPGSATATEPTSSLKLIGTRTDSASYGRRT